MTHPGAKDVIIRELAERQHGVVARWQLLARGIGHDAVAARVGNGRLIPVARGVYAVGRRAVGDEARWMTGVLRVGGDAVLSHRIAAALWTLRPSDGGLTAVTIRSPRGCRPRAALVVHRTVQLSDGDGTMRRGIPVTSVARTIVDVAAELRPHEQRRVIERAELLELFDLPKVEAAMERRAGVEGVPALRALLDDIRDHGLPRTRNDFESAFLQMCLDHRLPRPQVNWWDGERELDFRWPEHRLVVETDGWGVHRTRRAFESDSERSQILAAQGWTLMRVTWRQLTRRPDVVAMHVRRALGTSMAV